MDSNTTIGGGHAPATSEVLHGLNDLLQLDHDAVGAYEIAMEKLQDRDHADQIAGFRRDHERHIRELNELIAELGGTPKNEPHATGPFKLALQSLGGLAGDKGILMAWRTNELQVRTKYDSYAAKANSWPAPVKLTIDRAALDEERHYRWVAEALQRMGIGSGEGVETDLANRARERGAATGSKIDNLKDRVAEAAGSVRDRAHDLTDSARETVGGAREAVSNRISGLFGSDDTAGGGGPGVTQRVRDGMSGTVRYVREANPQELRGDVESQIREKPLQTLVVAGIAGFVIGRLLRS